MATTLTHAHALLTLPFNHSTAFTELADNCERFMDALLECDVPAEKFALYGRLAACLSLLQPTLLEPVPEALRLPGLGFEPLVGRVRRSCHPAKTQRCAFSSAISFGVVRQHPPISFAPAANHCGRYPASVSQASPW